MAPLTPFTEDAERGALTWDQHRDRTWSCREGGVIWKSGDRWAWAIAGRAGFSAGLAAAIFDAGAAWRGAQPDPEAPSCTDSSSSPP